MSTGLEQEQQRSGSGRRSVARRRLRQFCVLAVLVLATHRGSPDLNARPELESPRGREPPRGRWEPLVLVHLGKTAGSTLTCMLGLNGSGKGDSRCRPADFRPSAISRRVVGRVHLEPAPVDEYDGFVVTLRNPVDRITSWFYFVHPDFPPRLQERHVRGCANYREFFECYGSIQSLSEDGLSSEKGGKGGDGSCRKLASDMVTGANECWQNSKNYRYTYGALLERSRGQRAAVASGDDDGTTPRRRNLTVYGIRTEHLERDWTATDQLLGEKESRSSNRQDDLAIPRRNAWSDPDKKLSVIGRTNLCRALCSEIQIYKELLQLADNLVEQDVSESLDELVTTCPDEPREVRRCPTTGDDDA